MTSAYFTTLSIVVFLFCSQLLAKSPSPYFLLKDKIDQLELERSSLIDEADALSREANSFFGSKESKQKQLQVIDLIRQNYDPKIVLLKRELEKFTLKEKIEMWNHSLSRFTKDKRTLHSALNDHLGYVKLDCNPMFFKNESEFNFWITENNRDQDQIDKRLTFFSQKSDIIQSCIDNIIDKGKKIKVDRLFSDCNGLIINPVKYEISLKNSFITIDLNLKLVYKGKQENMAAVKSKFDHIQPCIKKILANQGLNFNLKYVYADEAKIKNSHATIKIYDQLESSDATNWGVLEEQGSLNNDNYICSFITHEILHGLGLGDKYKDSRCPGRVLGNSNHIMARSGVSPQIAKLSDQEVKTIIAPLCTSK